MTLPIANWNYPTSVKVGAGRASELPQWCASLGMKRPLLVTDPGLAALPMTVKLLDSCRSAGLDAGLFHAIKGNPTGKNVDDGVAAFKAGGHDGVIAFGGGSALDAAKAIALMAGQDRPLWDFEDVGDNHLRVNVAGMAPVVAIPTTAGTGSEVGRASVITDEREHVKRIIFHAKMLPAVVILDPELTVGLPPKITAATGMDALSHSLEAYCSPFYHPMAVGIAVEGIRLVKDYLPRACENGADMEARLQMLVASSMGATAFQRGLGAMRPGAPVGCAVRRASRPAQRDPDAICAARQPERHRVAHRSAGALSGAAGSVLRQLSGLGAGDARWPGHPAHAHADRHRREGGGTHRQDGARRWLGRH